MVVITPPRIVSKRFDRGKVNLRVVSIRVLASGIKEIVRPIRPIIVTM